MKFAAFGSVVSGLMALSLVGAPAYAEFKRLDMSGGDFTGQIEKIRADLAGGDAYADIQPADRATVLRLLDSISTGVDSVDDPMALSPRNRTALFNEQEQVNTLLSQAAEDSRQVCRRERPTGTRRSITSCTTAGEIRRNREESRDNLMRMPRAPENRDGRALGE